eukprot:5944175-Pleurochrysis_carterae.AAC.1
MNYTAIYAAVQLKATLVIVAPPRFHGMIRQAHNLAPYPTDSGRNMAHTCRKGCRNAPRIILDHATAICFTYDLK